jgi:hypothetical protein
MSLCPKYDGFDEYFSIRSEEMPQTSLLRMAKRGLAAHRYCRITKLTCEIENKRTVGKQGYKSNSGRTLNTNRFNCENLFYDFKGTICTVKTVPKNTNITKDFV